MKNLKLCFGFTIASLFNEKPTKMWAWSVTPWMEYFYFLWTLCLLPFDWDRWACTDWAGASRWWRSSSSPDRVSSSSSASSGPTDSRLVSGVRYRPLIRLQILGPDLFLKRCYFVYYHEINVALETGSGWEYSSRRADQALYTETELKPEQKVCLTNILN